MPPAFKEMPPGSVQLIPGEIWSSSLGHVLDSEGNGISLVEGKSGLFDEAGARKDWGKVLFDGQSCALEVTIPNNADGWNGKFTMVFIDDDPDEPKESIPVSVAIQVRAPIEKVIKVEYTFKAPIPAPEVTISEVNPSGQIILEFTEEVSKPKLLESATSDNYGINFFRITYEPSISTSIYLEDSNQVNSMAWKVLSVEPNRIVIGIIFDKANLVSIQNTKLDNIQFEFVKKDQFVGKNSSKSLNVLKPTETL